jgi:hypothetical protein
LQETLVAGIRLKDDGAHPNPRGRRGTSEPAAWNFEESRPANRKHQVTNTRKAHQTPPPCPVIDSGLM